MVGEAGEYRWPCLIPPPPNTSLHCGAQHRPGLSGLGNSGQALAKVLVYLTTRLAINKDGVGRI